MGDPSRLVYWSDRLILEITPDGKVLMYSSRLLEALGNIGDRYVEISFTRSSVNEHGAL